jgi:hypothetical protein
VCDLCNGSRVLHVEHASAIAFHNCPNCGPESDEEQESRHRVILSRLAAAMKEMERNVMNNANNQLRRAVEDRKEFLKSELMKYGYFKTPDGKQLYELTLTELEQIHINVKCQFGREISQDEKL